MKRDIKKINKVIIHHSLTWRDLPLHQSISSFDRTHKKRLHPEKNSKWYHISYHFVIWPDGKYITTRWLDEVWYHASNLNVNKTSIGICLTWNFDVMEPTPAQYETLKKLIKRLQWELGKLTIHGHNEYASKSCPWKNFNFDRLEEMNFYEKLRNDKYSTIPKKKRMFQDPDAFLKRIEELANEEKFSEIVFLIAIISEKLWSEVEKVK